MIHPFITDAQATQKIQEAFGTAMLGYKGSIKITDNIVADGIYIPIEDGTYTNAGGLTYEPNATDLDKLVIFIKDGSEWTKKTMSGLEGPDGPPGIKGQDGITTNLNPESPNTTLRMWEGTRNQYDEQQPLGDDVITFIREL